MTKGGRGWLLSAAVAVVAAAGCTESENSGDTLAPLPGPAVTGGTATAPASMGTAEPDTAALDTVTESTDVATTDESLLVGDWDGARFDAGVIEAVGALGGYRTIDFDRYSYRDPERGAVDAAGFTAEPIAYGWRSSPFFNIQPQLRTFVLANDVEVLVLSGGSASCAARPPATLPPPSWEPVPVGYLDRPAATGTIASLTYSDEGQVTRIRFTRGCEG